MSDFLIRMAGNAVGARLLRTLGLPAPQPLARPDGESAALPLQGRQVLLGEGANGYAADALRTAILAAGGALATRDADGAHPMLDSLVLDATGCRSPADLRLLYDFFYPCMPRIDRNARVLMVGPPTAPLQADATAAAAACAFEGFGRSLGKELGKHGTTVNLVHVTPDAVGRLDGVVRFFGGLPCTFVSGQVVQVDTAVRAATSRPWHRALDGKVALVTGSARGIGAAIAQRLAREGARVVCLDVPQAHADLHRHCNAIGAVPLILDITQPDAPRRVADFLTPLGGLDVLVHNAGITRDRTLAKMPPHHWDQVMAVNLGAILAIDRLLIAEGQLHDEGRIVCLSSIGGVAGNFGQTNYSASKAALIGYVAAQAPLLAPRGICINAVAPGFIETTMTAQMPWLPREIGRRLNALRQGGLPADVAELVNFLASPTADGVSGQTIRVCGLGLMGA